ncbi:MAG: cation:proton antiporter subunit C [Thermoplasmata archaeon]|nr:cation:proton antiporter subunit C [Thermoplasmata archaeon]
MTTALGELPYITVIALLAIGLYIILVKKNLIKIAMGIVIMEAGANLFLITLAFNSGDRLSAPVFTSQIMGGTPATYSLPTPHALTLTSIVIGLATTALLLSFIMQAYKKHKVTSTDEFRRLRG